METAVSTETLVTIYYTVECHNTVRQNPKQIVYRVLTQAASDDGSKYQKAKHVAGPVFTGALCLAPSLHNLFI
jgi:hypothetical protein